MCCIGSDSSGVVSDPKDSSLIPLLCLSHVCRWPCPGPGFYDVIDPSSSPMGPLHPGSPSRGGSPARDPERRHSSFVSPERGEIFKPTEAGHLGSYLPMGYQVRGRRGTQCVNMSACVLYLLRIPCASGVAPHWTARHVHAHAHGFTLPLSLLLPQSTTEKSHDWLKSNVKRADVSDFRYAARFSGKQCLLRGRHVGRLCLRQSCQEATHPMPRF